MRSRHRSHPLLLALAALALLSSTPDAARAGCGCDHPPPDWSLVMPPFGSVGREIQIFPTVGEFVPGAVYRVTFEQQSPSRERDVTVVAQSASHLRAQVPNILSPGPVEIRVLGSGYNQTYGPELFTVLPKARIIPPGTGSYMARDFKAAVSADGVLYVPVSVAGVRDATQFAFGLRGLSLAFGQDDLSIYNADGVDLSLFTLQVSDPTQYRWGEYYGWEVEQDTGLYGVVYDEEVEEPEDLLGLSNVATYWRHEFHTYANAHAPGGSHEVDGSGLHPDGSAHVDHHRLVLAISGKERNRNQPADLDSATPLEGGRRTVDLAWISIESVGPIPPADMARFVEEDVDDLSPELEEDDD